MKFSVERTVLVQMLRLLAGGRVKKEARLRIMALDGRVTLTAEDLTEASYDAVVSEVGVCFFRHKQLLPLLRSYSGEKTLTMEVTADGIQIGSTSISRGMWEISLFMNPANAPQRLFLKVSEPQGPVQRCEDDFKLESQ